MEFLELLASMGLILFVFGIIKRKEPWGRRAIFAGIFLLVVPFILYSYNDFKAGFIDALND